MRTALLLRIFDIVGTTEVKGSFHNHILKLGFSLLRVSGEFFCRFCYAALRHCFLPTLSRFPPREGKPAKELRTGCGSAGSFFV